MSIIWYDNTVTLLFNLVQMKYNQSIYVGK